jgi:hypothetical protein
LDSFVLKNNLLNESQYGFRSKRSTSLALLELTEEITKSVDSKKITIGVYIDLKKAFDTINHDLLLKKMEQYGIRGIANDWVKSYLSNRFQYVQYDDCKSDSLKVLCGVPQGSILGPQLFLLYINDICNVSEIVKFILFADDTNLFYSDNTVDKVESVLNSELKKLCEWFNLNKLSLNVLKTNYMLFGKNKGKHNIAIYMNNSKIDRVSETKFLGVMIDESLTWKSHITYIGNKIAKSIGILYKASK